MHMSKNWKTDNRGNAIKPEFRMVSTDFDRIHIVDLSGTFGPTPVVARMKIAVAVAHEKKL